MHASACGMPRRAGTVKKLWARAADGDRMALAHLRQGPPLVSIQPQALPPSRALTPRLRHLHARRVAVRAADFHLERARLGHRLRRRRFSLGFRELLTTHEEAVYPDVRLHCSRRGAVSEKLGEGTLARAGEELQQRHFKCAAYARQECRHIQPSFEGAAKRRHAARQRAAAQRGGGAQ